MGASLSSASRLSSTGTIAAYSSTAIAPGSNPSGDSTPSPDDVQLTRRLEHAANILDIALLDHLIVGDGRYFSFRETGALGASPSEGLR